MPRLRSPSPADRESVPREISARDAMAQLAEAKDMLRAIGAGEVDAFVISGGDTGRHVFTLSTADRPYRMFVENMRDGAATLSDKGLILYANSGLAELLGYARETIVGSPLSRFLTAGEAIQLSEIKGADGLGATLELDLLTDTGDVVPVQVGSSPLVVDDEPLICLTFTDLSAHRAQDREIARLGQAQTERMAELQDAQAALTKQATHDALTGLPNRALLVDRISQALHQSQRSGRRNAVLFVDLDRFKQVNDTQGHAAGDSLLREVAERLTAALRPMDTVARIGGDEFVILAPDIDSDVHVVDLSARLITELGRRPEPGNHATRVAASIGISVSVGGRGTAESLLNEADTAMYQAKSLGGGRATVFDEALGHQIRQRSIAQQRLQSALDERRIVAHYQPIVDLDTARITGFEALARVSENDGSLTLPGAFIPVAEDSGLVVPLGAQMLDVACDAARGWRTATTPESPERRLTVAVNLSTRQFDAGNLTTIVREALQRSGLDPTCLHLELTETTIIDLDPDFLAQLGQLGDLGVQIGLDDFGTGYASLTHLRRLPLTFVKIDRTFVQGLGSGEDERIVAAVVDLVANLGLRSIAEGVETAVQLGRLRELGCNQAQGYLFDRPLVPGDIPAAVERRLVGDDAGIEASCTTAPASR